MDESIINEQTLAAHVEAFEQEQGVNTQQPSMMEQMASEAGGEIFARLEKASSLEDDIEKENKRRFEEAMENGTIMNGMYYDDDGLIHFNETMEEGRDIEKIFIESGTGESKVEKRARLQKESAKKPKSTKAKKAEKKATDVILPTTTSKTYKEGYTNLEKEELPSMGKHYKADLCIGIRGCTMNELRHWSLLPIESLIERENAINYILDNCTNVFSSMDGKEYSFRDLLEADRIYILLAIRELTFGEDGEPMVMDIDKAQHKIQKEHIMQFDFMKHSKVAGKKSIKMTDDGLIAVTIPKKHSHTGGEYDILFHIPTIGTTMWLQYYLASKVSEEGSIDTDTEDLDFYQCAMVLMNYNEDFGLEEYEALKAEFLSLTPGEVGIIRSIRDIIIEVAKPTISYIDKGGVEREVPLSFRDGIRSLFCVSDPLEDLE